MLKTFFAAAVLVVLFATPAAAGLGSDYLTQNDQKLPQKTFDLMKKQRGTRAYGERTAGGKAHAAKKKRSRKERRRDRHIRAQQKKTEKLFGTFNQ